MQQFKLVNLILVEAAQVMQLLCVFSSTLTIEIISLLLKNKNNNKNNQEPTEHCNINCLFV